MAGGKNDDLLCYNVSLLSKRKRHMPSGFHNRHKNCPANRGLAKQNGKTKRGLETARYLNTRQKYVISVREGRFAGAKNERLLVNKYRDGFEIG
jgi:hypothetical protein